MCEGRFRRDDASKKFSRELCIYFTARVKPMSNQGPKRGRLQCVNRLYNDAVILPAMGLR